MRVSTSQIPPRFNGHRVLGAGLVVAVFTSFTIPTALLAGSALVEGRADLLNLTYQDLLNTIYVVLTAGFFGFFLALPLCLFTTYPLTRWMERRLWTSYRDASVAGAFVGLTLGAVIWLITASMNVSYNGGLDTESLQRWIRLLLLTAGFTGVFGVLSGLLARFVMGQPSSDVSDCEV